MVASTTGSFAPTLTGCVTLPRTNTGVNAPYFIDPTSNNWQLGVGSSLINSGIDHATIAGVPVFDLLNVTRSQGAGYDIGAYEPITTSANSSTLSLTATSNVSILNGGILTIDANTTASALTVNSGGQLTLNNGFTLNASLLTIQADTAKSGSFVDFNTTGGLTVSGTSSVQQWLSTGRNWYVSSPVSNASSAVVNAAGGLNKLYWYDEAHSSTNPWPQISTNDITLQAMKGYIFNMAADGNVTFTGNFNTGSKSITVSRTTGEIKEGFNLIGNPYPSYVNWDLATKTNISSTIWYRTKAKSGSYTFDTYNAISHVGTNTNGVRAVTGLIPPMQTVWVRVDVGQSSGSVAFNNNMRSHKTELATALKAKSLNNEIQQSVRLSVSNGINNDETILVFNPAASNDLDGFDSEKMSNNNSSFPEIFTSTNSKNLTINGLKTIPYDTEIPIGFTTLSAGNFKIIASDVKNISQETLLVLKDNYTGAQTNL